MVQFTCIGYTAMRRRPLWEDLMKGMRRLYNDNLTTENQEQSTLLRLPGELRTAIYEYALGGQDITIRKHLKTYQCKAFKISYYVGPLNHVNHVIDIDGDEWSYSDDVSLLLALQRTCRQIYQETTGMWFALNTFQGRADAIPAFITHPNTKIQHIQSVRLRFNAVTRQRGVPRVPVILTSDLHDALVSLRLLERLKKISIVLPRSERPERDTEEAILAEMRRVLELEREGTRVQITLEFFDR
ncbi:hypothetical protein BU25DRAFT_462610 [Macroventuria anomochaeta]|uniref:Uncharacterized protein n=1 Tax=Macroventuria anomochaeta TaxID=301207 RepID=A0ACB6RMX1_9PLEO|nr:uncharacterized protein BU25DRAFT_462610 [Macroventuria anomochaeta]KAF2622750.1 hypothetical protein BU25DRAFT_462610 [Macroventuria anomochaeta]